MTDYSNLFDMSGRTALVVGAGSGIGQASAEGLAAFGAHVICADIDLEHANVTVSGIMRDGGSAVPCQLASAETK